MMPEKATCSVNECEKPARTKQLCKMHYTRQLRYGTLELTRSRKKSYIHTAGYIVEHDPEHPLCNSAGEVYQHRRVFFDVYGLGPFKCFGCEKVLGWEDLHIDHKDHVRDNNDLSNLQASCQSCNVRKSTPLSTASLRAKYGLMYKGEKYSINQLAAMKGMSREGIAARLLKMTIDEAMEMPKTLPGDPRPWRVKEDSRRSKRKIRQAKMRDKA